MRLQTRLSLLLNIRSGEGRVVGLLLLHCAFIGFTKTYLETASGTLFLVQFGAQALPYVYIGAALVTALTGFTYAKLAERLSFIQLLGGNLSIILLSLVALRLLLSLTDAAWPVMILPIWTEVVWTLSGLEIWTLAIRLLDLRQGKRLFGLIGSGEVLAAATSGLSVPILVKLFDVSTLLLFSAAAVVGSLIMLIGIAGSFGSVLTSRAEGGLEESRAAPTRLMPRRYLGLILAQCALAFAGLYVFENIFYNRVEVQYPDSSQLASFLGLLWAASSVFRLAAPAVITGPTLRRYGIRIGLLVLPVALVIGTTLVAVFGTLWGGVTILFWLVVVTKFLDRILRYTLHHVAVLSLYQPLPPEKRLQAQTLVEGIIEPIAFGVTGITLLFFTKFLAFGPIQLSYVMCILLAGWLIVAKLLHKEYRDVLVDALRRRRLSGAALSQVDESTVAVLRQGLSSPYAGEVIYVMTLLADSAPESLTALLPGLLAHPNPQVRREALGYIERLELTRILASVDRLLSHETNDTVKGAALHTLAALGEAGELEQIFPYLDALEPEVRMGAMVGLLRSGGIEGVLTAGQKLLHMVNSRDPVERALAARVLGRVGARRFFHPVLSLLRDDNLQVRREALLAAGRLKNPKLWPLVLESLGSSQVHRVAAAALIASGDSALPELRASFEQEGQRWIIMIRLARIFGRIQGDEVIALLKEKIDFPDVRVRTQLLRSLTRCGYQADGEEIARVQQQIEAEVVDATWTLAALSDIDAGVNPTAANEAAVSLLRAALTYRLAQNRSRLFHLLTFIYDRQTVLRARDNLFHASSEKKAYALEVIDILVSKEMKRLLLPLLRNLSPGQRLQHLSAFCPQPSLSCHRRLEEIIAEPDGRVTPWTKACALYAAGRLSFTELSKTVVSTLSAPDPLIRETAVWTLSRLNPSGLHSQLDLLRHDPSLQAVQAVERLEIARNGDELVLSTIEKVIILKSVSIFDQTPDDILAGVALLLEETEFEAEEMIFEKGDAGVCMYIIVDGQVRVHDGRHTLSQLGERDVFGEMALLDAEPRVASVTAVSDTRLLRLDQEPFYELMADQIEVARGVIQVLSSRLRAADQDLNTLQARLEAIQSTTTVDQE